MSVEPKFNEVVELRHTIATERAAARLAAEQLERVTGENEQLLDRQRRLEDALRGCIKALDAADTALHGLEVYYPATASPRAARGLIDAALSKVRAEVGE